MKMTRQFFLFLPLMIMLSISIPTKAQVTIGSNEIPAYGALLELKTKQTGSVTNVGDNTNITSTNGGLLLPRVKLTSFTSLNSVVENGDALTNEQKLKLAGLMVYNINAVPNTLYLGVYVWNGASWAYLVDSKVSSPMTVGAQPKAFSFYEKGTETPVALVFTVNPPKAADGTIGTVNYQWYQLVGSNVHARIGEEIGQPGTVSGSGATTNSFVPNGVVKGTTVDANNTGFYRFYCVATGSDGSTLKSSIVEVAVGCGAKNNLGEWIPFMCFNLGADKDLTIQEQKDYPIGTFSNDINGQHIYIPNSEKVWGDSYQWGRIADGHEKRTSSVKAMGDGTALASNIGNGYNCRRSATGILTGFTYPYQQVKPTATVAPNDWYGRFISNTTAPYNWTPVVQITADQLWRLGRFVVNDPCAKYKTDGTFVPAWTTQDVPVGNNAINPDPACKESGTAWRTPVQADWSDIYRGTQIEGSPDIATANTWKWYNGTPTNYNRGYEIKPDGINGTTTLFLPANGFRDLWSATKYNQSSEYGAYWSTTTVNTGAYYLSFNRGSVNPANSYHRAYGMALRCIKN